MKPAIIVDIDGTIAHRITDRSPYDWHRVGEDGPDYILIDLLFRYYHSGINIILMSGRDSVCEAETEEWIKTHMWDLNDYLLLMRKEKDKRKDTIVKQELYEEHVKDKYNVMFVLDDRNQVVEMWRSLGLKCLQVAPGKF